MTFEILLLQLYAEGFFMPKYKCKLCKEVEFEKYTSLSRHMGLTHHVSTDQFYVEYYLNGIWPTCKCGCGERMKYSYQLKSFRDYKKGHIARIRNNWGHNQKALEHSAETRRERFATGEIQVWNKGLTIDDERVKLNISASTSAINSNPYELHRRSELMAQQRKNGTIPDLKGPQHSQWKGGVSEINILARTDHRLYDEWKYPILVRDKFKCVECGGSDGGLHVHHDKELMCEIVKKHMVDGVVITDFEFKKSIASKIVDYHINNHVSGITLCGKCHEEKHPSLNFG